MASVALPASPLYLGFFFDRKFRAETLRSPGWGISALAGKLLMQKFNAESAVHAVEQLLAVDTGSTCVELGPGGGFGLQAILARHPARVIGVEVSANFRAELAGRFADAIKRGVLEVRGEDAISMPFLPTASVDRVFAMNVIYFLSPLDAYLAEIFRCLRPGGLVIFGVKEMIKGNEPSVFVNQDWRMCIAAMKRAGFEAESGEVQLEGAAAYTPLIGRKPR